MNLGQTMITLGMFILLMMTVISANRILIENAKTATQTDALASASVLSNNLFAEIMRKPFDQNVVIDTTAATWRQDTTGIKISSESSLSPYNGSKWGVRGRLTLPDDTTGNNGNYRSRTILKDIDDYDGYSRTARVVIRPGETVSYTIAVTVYYVVWSAPDVLTSTQTFFKKVGVTVTQSQYGVSQVYSAVASY